MTSTKLFFLTACWVVANFALDMPIVVGQLPEPGPVSSSKNNLQNFAPEIVAGGGKPQINDRKTTAYKFTGRFHLQAGTNQGYLVLQCELPPGSYIHSLSPTGSPRPSSIRVTPSEQFSLTGKFNPDQPPTVIEKDPIFEQRLEKHKGKVQFFVPVQVAENANLSELQPELIFDGQVCSSKGVCLPLHGKSVKAKFAGYFERSTENRNGSQNTQNK